MLDYVTHPGSYLGIFAFLVLTGCGMPIPEEVALVLAGVLSGQGKLEPQLAFATCLAGALVGDAVMYSIGYHFGHNLLVKHPKFSRFIGADREVEFEQALMRHGFKVLLLSRFLVGVRGPVYLASGVVRMPFRKFLLWDLISATLVVGLFFGVSYYYGESIATWLREAERTFTLLVLAVVGVVVLWILRRNRRRIIESVLDDNGNDGPQPSADASGESRASKRDETIEKREAS